MRYNIPEVLLPHIQTRSVTDPDYYTNHILDRARVLITEPYRDSMTIGETGVVTGQCAMGFEVTKDGGGTGHARAVALIDQPTTEGEHVLCIEDLPPRPGVASFRGGVYEIDESPTGGVRPVGEADGTGRDAAARGVLGHLRRSFRSDIPPSSGTARDTIGIRCWVGTYVKVNDSILDVATDVVTTDAAPAERPWQVGDRFTVSQISSVRVGAEPVRGTVLRVGRTGAFQAAFDEGQDMAYPSGQLIEGVPTWQINSARATRLEDHDVWRVGDRVLVHDPADIDTEDYDEDFDDSLYIHGRVISISGHRLRIELTEPISAPSGVWVDESHVWFMGRPTGSEGESHAARPWQEGDVVRITGHQEGEHIGTYGKITSVGTRVGGLGVDIRIVDPHGGGPFTVNFATSADLILAADAPQPALRLGQRVIGVENRLSDRIILKPGTLVSRSRTTDYPGELDYAIDVDWDITRVGYTRIAVIEDVPRPWQVGDAVRITGHGNREYVGRLGRIILVNSGEGVLGVTVQTAEGITGLSTELELLLGADETQPTFSEGDEVFGVTHVSPRQNDNLELMLRRATVRNATQPTEDGTVLPYSLRITEGPYRWGHHVRFTRIAPVNRVAPTTQAAAEDDEGPAYVRGDIVTFGRDHNYFRAGRPVIVTSVDEEGNVSVRTAGGDLYSIRNFESYQPTVTHRGPRLPRQEPGTPWTSSLVEIPIDHIEAIASMVGQAHSESGKVDLLMKGLRHGYFRHGTSVWEVESGTETASFASTAAADAWIEAQPAKETRTWGEIRTITQNAGRSRLGWCSVANTVRDMLEPQDPRRARIVAPAVHTVRQGPGGLPWEVVSPDGRVLVSFRHEDFARSEAQRLNDAAAPATAADNPF